MNDDGPMATWRTITTLKESLTTTLNFVAHHLTIGASEIILYFEDPNDPAIEKLKGIEQVKIIACDEPYWSSLGGCPKTHEDCQTANANHAYQRPQSDWLIHIDADEWIDCDVVLADCLDAEEGEVLRLEPLEILRYRKAGQGLHPSHVFKYPLPKGQRGTRIGELVYGRYNHNLRRGSLSHEIGKFLMRTGIKNGHLRIHTP